MMRSTPYQVADIMATDWPQAAPATPLTAIAETLTTAQASVVVIVEPAEGEAGIQWG